MKYNYKIFTALVVLLALAACKKNDDTNKPVTPPSNTVVTAPSNLRVVGYMLSGDIASGAASSFNTARVNYLNITLGDTSTEGAIADIANLDAMITAAHKNNVKVLASIGNDFVAPEFYANETARTRFINKLMTSIIAHNFDGIDVDIEGDYINNNYEVFIGEISAAAKLQNKILTAAIATWESAGFTDKALSYYDYLNVMSYDKTGPWDPSDPGQHSPYSMAVNDLDYWTHTRGLAKEKLNLGVPFYGYGFGSGPVGTLTYKQIVHKFPGSQDHDQLKQPDGATLYYNGIPTIKKKTQLAMQSAGGVMIWELMYDTEGDNSLLTAIDETAKGN